MCSEQCLVALLLLKYLITPQENELVMLLRYFIVKVTR